MRLADLVKAERKKRGWSQKRLAQEAGVSPATISRFEAGEILGHADTIARITGALGLSPVTVQAALREEAEAGEIQMIDLRNVPPEERAALRRAIDALVREWQRGGQGER